MVILWTECHVKMENAMSKWKILIQRQSQDCLQTVPGFQPIRISHLVACLSIRDCIRKLTNHKKIISSYKDTVPCFQPITLKSNGFHLSSVVYIWSSVNHITKFWILDLKAKITLIYHSWIVFLVCCYLETIDLSVVWNIKSLLFLKKIFCFILALNWSPFLNGNIPLQNRTKLLSIHRATHRQFGIVLQLNVSLFWREAPLTKPVSSLHGLKYVLLI